MEKKATHARKRSARKRSTSRKKGSPRRSGQKSGPAGLARRFRRGPEKRPNKRMKDDVIPELAKDTIRIVPLGGVEEVGRNMTAIELNDEIVIVDCGFMFQEDHILGADYILPNTQYLEDRAHKVKAMVITHGHLDHIGAIPYVMDRIGNPPIYTQRLTAVMIKKRQEEFPHLPTLDIREVETKDKIKVGSFTFRFFSVTHTIPDSMGVIVKTPVGSVVVTGDIKLDHKDGVPHEKEVKSFSIFKDEEISCLLMDSTNVERPGWSIPEHRVFETFKDIIKNAKHRLIIGTFASQLERVMKIIEIAEENGKKIVIEGRSMKTNVEIARELKLFTTKPGTIISSDAMQDYPENKIVVLATGAQGDEYAALMRAAEKNHKYLKLNELDTIVFSSSVIPGNERAVQSLKDKLARQGVHIITYQTSDVHASGHGNAEEAKWIHKQINPRFFIPQHGYHYMLRAHGALIEESCKLPPEHVILPDNGSLIEIRDGGKNIVRLKEKAPMTTRIVEGMYVHDVQEAVMKDRQLLSQDGIFVIVITVHLRTGKLKKSPDIISRGFIYLRESQELLGQTRLIIKKAVESSLQKSGKTDIDAVKKRSDRCGF